jgi:hypothetical protein
MRTFSCLQEKFNLIDQDALAPLDMSRKKINV